MRRREFVSLTAGALAASTPAKRSARELASDPHRPKYHFLPPANWMNDPNGPLYWKGRYHMFYQYNPNGAFWGSMHWGHAVSPDMIHWQHLPVAMAPQPGSYDKDGVFSGCAVVNDGVPTLVYTGTQPEVQCLATSRDPLLRTWTRHPANPVIAKPPAGIEATGFRDPCVWREGRDWYMALGSGRKGVGGMVLLYRSPDLVQWTYMHPLFEGKMDLAVKRGGPVATGEMWECPSFFPLGNKHVLFVSTRGTTPYWIGSYRDFRFYPESEGRLDTGAYYAPITQLDARGRRVLWGWIQEQRSGEAQRAAGWSGVLSVPRVLGIAPDGSLGMEPAAQTRSLRGRRQEFANLAIPDGRPEPVPGLAGDALEIEAVIDCGSSAECGLEVLGTPVLYSSRERRLSVGEPRSESRGNLVLDSAEPLRLHIFVDCSVIEVFANGRCCVTGRAYPQGTAAPGLSLLARGGTATARSVIAWAMKPISPDRLATG